MNIRLQHDLSERSEIPSANSEAKCLIQRAAEPRPVGDSVKAAIGRAARRLGWSFSRAKDVWYGDARRIDVEEMDRLRAFAGAGRNNEATADELADLRARLARLELHLDQMDAAAGGALRVLARQQAR